MASKRGKKQPQRKQDPQKAADKRARREERQRLEAEARAQAARKARLRKVALGSLGGIAAVALAVILVVSLTGSSPEVEGVERPPELGRDHLEQGEAANYPTATPTSGPHATGAAPCGVYSSPLPLEFAVHDLEHGVVVVWYRPDLENDLLPSLRTLISQWDSHVIVSPNPGISDPIVATAWNRLKRFDTVEPGLAEFIDTYRKRGPEAVACNIEEL